MPPQCGFFNTFRAFINPFGSDYSQLAGAFRPLRFTSFEKVHTPGQRATFSSTVIFSTSKGPQVHHVSRCLPHNFSTFLDASSASDPYLELGNLKSGHSQILCCHFKKKELFPVPSICQPESFIVTDRSGVIAYPIIAVERVEAPSFKQDPAKSPEHKRV